MIIEPIIVIEISHFLCLHQNYTQPIALTFFFSSSIISINPLEAIILVMMMTFLLLGVHIYRFFQSFHGENAAFTLKYGGDSPSFCFCILFLEKFAKSISGPLSWKNFSASSLKDSLNFKEAYLPIAGRRNRPQMEMLSAPTCAHLWKCSHFKTVVLARYGPLLGPCLRCIV